MAESSKLVKGKRVTGKERDELSAALKKEYTSGKSIRQIATDHGRSYGFVHRILSDAKVPLRGRGGATRTKKA